MPPSRLPALASRGAVAVVADEVRTLAGRTQASTGEIVAIIETLQARANQAKEVTGQSCEMIRQCVEQSEQTSNGIQQIEEAVAQIADMAIQIASACGEQDAVSDELGRNAGADQRILQRGRRWGRSYRPCLPGAEPAGRRSASDHRSFPPGVMLLRAREGDTTAACIGRHPNNRLWPGCLLLVGGHFLGHVVCNEGITTRVR